MILSNNYYRSVFVSNLQYNTNEEQLKDLFEKVSDLLVSRFVGRLIFVIENQCGAVMEVRLVKVNGKLKGYGYIQFLNESSVKKALELDRTLVNRRPIFVSKCVEKEKRQQSRPKFTNEVNKRVIFVKNLPTSLTEECIRKLFSKCGAIREVRMVKHKSGEFKGYLYLEFEREVTICNSIIIIIIII
jgi:RNA recognition motif-containing protein